VDAELMVDGQSRGAADQTLRLTSVPHEIEIRKPGFESVRQTVIPRPGFPQAIRVTLRTEEEARVAERLEIIESPQGPRLRLVRPGRFQMGASRREPGRRANETLREVELTRAYYLGVTEVTNREFREFLQTHRSGQAGSQSLDQDDYPVVRVGWEQAARYCNWLSERASLPRAYVERNGRLVGVRPMTTGYRLPSEAEWVWVARYAGGEGEQKYPWGEALPVEAGSGNYADEAASGLINETLSGYSDGFAATAPVDSFEPNALGIFNLGGNVAEWVHDLYTIYSGGTESVQRDPLGPDDGTYHVIRGSSWMDATITELRWSFRDYGDKPRADVGFRIARYAD
jgi:formylglycine-generating enzyme required for sulfatase activity